MLFWRPILEGVITFTEANQLMSLNDLLKINALLDMKSDYTRAVHESNK